MPLYEYQCDACGHRFERIQKFSDPPPGSCVSCGGPVRKLMSAPAIQFKGSGWYITDYARKGGGDAGKSDGAGAKAPSTTPADTGGGSSSSDTKPSAPAPSSTSGSGSEGS